MYLGDIKSSFRINNYLYLCFQGAKQSMELLTKKTTSSRAISKIRKYDDDFEPKEFAEKAKEIYIKAHQAMTEYVVTIKKLQFNFQHFIFTGRIMTLYTILLLSKVSH